MVHYLLRHESSKPNAFTVAFERGFGRLRDAYGRGLAWALHHRAFVVGSFTLFVAGSMAMLLLVGRDFFPTSTRADQAARPRRGRDAARETEKRIATIEQTIRGVSPVVRDRDHDRRARTPYSASTCRSARPAVSPATPDPDRAQARPSPTAGYVRALRTSLRKAYPETTFFFLAPDISTQVLNFGLAGRSICRSSGRSAARTRRSRSPRTSRQGRPGPRRRRRPPRAGLGRARSSG